jgi:hypothetical protein|tara:strand:+ start:4159 stop:4800 length:642 start_codon:yes stop_codon:yes gene_type:complete
MNEVDKYKSWIKTTVWVVLGALIIIAGGRKFFVVGDTGFGTTLMIIGSIPILVTLFTLIKSKFKKSSGVKLPSTKNIFIRRKKYFVGVLVVAIAIFVWQTFFASPVKILKNPGTPLIALDNLNVWLIKDGKVTVTRELNVYKDGIGTKIIAANLDENDRKDITIYESIPKEIAQNVSELEFSHPVEIIEEDPLILWNLSMLPGTRETLTIKKN